MTTLELPTHAGSRAQARELTTNLPPDLSGETIALDFSRSTVSSPSFLDELVKEVVVIRKAERIDVVNPPPRTATLLERAAENRAVADRLHVTRTTEPSSIDSSDSYPDDDLRASRSGSTVQLSGVTSQPSTLTCFVIGPIGNRLAARGTSERQTYEDALRVMEEVVEPACATVGLSPVRADTLARAGEITEQIFRRLRDDDVVIADLTGANANVMYELGLRHTRMKLTIQIGEYGRLPFDVNTIRTIQFSRSPVGLINARNELEEVLSAGLAGEYDLVTATRVWSEAERMAEALGQDVNGPSANEDTGDTELTRGPLDLIAEAEEHQDELVPAIDAVGKCVVELGELAESSAAQIHESDAAGKGMRGRLQIITQYAHGADAIAIRLDDAVSTYTRVLDTVSGGILALIGLLREDPEQLTAPEVWEFAVTTRKTATIARGSMSSLAEMAETIKVNARLSTVLREPSRKLTHSLARFAEATSVIDEYDRQLQALGVPMPSDTWEPPVEGDNREKPS